MIAYSDFIAAEHLQVHTADPHATAKKLRNYGSLFIGPLASVVYSDKCCGTNHTLPTMGAGALHGRAVGRLLRQDLHAPVARRARLLSWPLRLAPERERRSGRPSPRGGNPDESPMRLHEQLFLMSVTDR